MFFRKKKTTIEIFPVEKIYPPTPYLVIGGLVGGTTLFKRRYVTVTLNKEDFYTLLNSGIGTDFVVGVYKEYEKDNKMFYDVICEKKVYEEIKHPMWKASD